MNSFRLTCFGIVPYDFYSMNFMHHSDRHHHSHLLCVLGCG